MRDYANVINLIVRGTEIVGCTVINPITLAVGRFRGENSKKYINEIPKKSLHRYAKVDTQTGILYNDSYTIIGKTYGYMIVCNGNASKIYILKESELIKNRVRLGAEFTNIDFVKRIDNKGESIQRVYGTTPDISTLLYSGVLDSELAMVQYHIEKLVDLRIQTIQNIDIQTYGIKPYTINNLVSNKISLIETLDMFPSLRKEILKHINKKQTVRTCLLETVNIREIMEKCEKDF